jgi:splicing factor U2AF subunit
VEDVKEECERFGTVVEVRIPRPTPDNADVPGIGKIFVRFANETECTVALRALAGRRFAERTVLTAYVSEEDYTNQNY